MKILAFDTSTEACVVGVLVDGEIIEHFSIPEQKHTLILLPIIQDLLQQAGLELPELDVIAYGQGPGAFTGVRLAVSVAQGLGFGAEVPVTGISSLAAVAQQVYIETKQQHVLVAMDARMGEVYFGAFQFAEDAGMTVISEEQVISLTNISIPQGDRWIAVGTGWGEYPDVKPDGFSQRVTNTVSPGYASAAALLSLAERAVQDNRLYVAEQAVPVYLRNNIVNN